MEAQNPLSELADIHLPGEVSWWPLAFGWWVLLLLVLAAIAWGVVLWLRRAQLKKRLQTAIDELDIAWRHYLSRTAIDPKQFSTRRGTEAVILLNAINAVLKRVALVHFPADDISELSGKQWLTFLDSCDNSSHFSEKTGKVLGETLYRKSYDEDPAPVYRLAKAWIHRRYLLDGTQQISADIQEAQA